MACGAACLACRRNMQNKDARNDCPLCKISEAFMPHILPLSACIDLSEAT